MTREYTTGEYVWTNISYVRTDTSVTVKVSSTGNFKAFPASRNYVVRLINNNPLTSASVNNMEVMGSRFGGANSSRGGGSRRGHRRQGLDLASLVGVAAEGRGIREECAEPPGLRRDHRRRIEHVGGAVGCEAVRGLATSLQSTISG